VAKLHTANFENGNPLNLKQQNVKIFSELHFAIQASSAKVVYQVLVVFVILKWNKQIVLQPIDSYQIR